MIIKINKGDYNLVYSDEGKPIRVKEQKGYYSECTEFVNNPKEYEEKED